MKRAIAWWRRRSSRRYWENSWRRNDYAPPWLGRGVSREIISAFEDGWFVPGAPALDIGCGEGEVVAWLAERGFPTLGIDIADAAIVRARKRFAEASNKLEFQRLDICTNVPMWSGGTFTNLIDRGCFHQIPDQDLRAYAQNIARASSSTARFLLFVKAFRDGASGQEERDRHSARVRNVLNDSFSIERMNDTLLDPQEGQVPEKRLPGLVFWLRKR